VKLEFGMMRFYIDANELPGTCKWCNISIDVIA